MSDNRNNNKLMIILAHPDDAETECGGTVIKFIKLGGEVTIVSMTNGNAGHQTMTAEELTKRRYEETQRVAKHFGGKVNYIILDNNDAQLTPNLENRHELIRLIRKENPDIIITHRTSDYHPDHRATSQLVQDASYLWSVPAVCPDTKRLDNSPLVLYHQDDFKRPYEFTPTIFVDISDVIEEKMKILSFHESQVFEWLPYIEGYLDEVPEDAKSRIKFLIDKWANTGNVNRFLNKVNGAKYLEAFEVSEYGGTYTREKIKLVMPFVHLI